MDFDQKSIPTGAVAFFITCAVILDAIKLVLLVLDAIPVLGIVLSAVVGFIISVLEIVVIYGGLALFGAFKNPKSTTSNMLFTLLGSVLDLIPELDDLPWTTGTVIGIIWNSRQADKKLNAERKAHAQAAEAESKAQAERTERAQEAAGNADAMREQAMEESLQAANDNDEYAASNDNDDYDYAQAA